MNDCDVQLHLIAHWIIVWEIKNRRKVFCFINIKLKNINYAKFIHKEIAIKYIRDRLIYHWNKVEKKWSLIK